MIHIINHRGLNAEDPSYHPESSEAAFRDQLQQGFGLEFDPQLTKDGQLVVLHDASFGRLTHGVVDRRVNDMTLEEVTAVDLSGTRILSLRELLTMIEALGAQSLHAIHVKAGNQHPVFLDRLLHEIQSIDTRGFILFDLKPETARYLKERRPQLQLAPSVAHPYDIERYNHVVGGTLHTIEEAARSKELFSWVWMDEWDRRDKKREKTFYNAESFARLRGHGFKIALVTPELHATSPGLLGGESHPDAANRQLLFARFVAILALGPDAVCTDYTRKHQAMLQQ